MIVGKANEKQWMAECTRLEKKLNEITSGAKDARKKHSYFNVEVARLSTAVILFLIRN